MATEEFGPAVRHWRERIAPSAVGLPASGRRRAAGLRREELAQLAGISVDYLTRLEQGRAANPSEPVVAALARALRLSTEERSHLFRLAGRLPPGPEMVPTHITPSVQRLLDRLGSTPVVVSDATWTLLVANPMYAALMGDPSGWRGNQRNGVWRNLLGPPSRVRHTPQSRREFEAAIVADLRAAASRYPNDPRLQRLVAELRANSPRFVELWDSGAVAQHRAERKTIDHPEVGVLTLDCDVLTVSDTDLHITVYTAEPGTADAERLALLSVLGTETLVGQLEAQARYADSSIDHHH